jgi:hypothetical protein
MRPTMSAMTTLARKAIKTPAMNHRMSALSMVVAPANG